MSPSRTRRPMTRPETADLTSTLMSGSTTPTSRTLTWRSSDCTLPRRNGDSSTSGFDLVVARATTRVPPTSNTAAPAITHLFLRIWPFFLHDRGSGSFFFSSDQSGSTAFRSSLRREGGKGYRGKGEKRDSRDGRLQDSAGTACAKTAPEPLLSEVYCCPKQNAHRPGLTGASR